VAITRAGIELNYRYTIAQAKILEEAAQSLRSKTVKEIEQSINDIQSLWTGDNARAFLRKEDMLKTKVQKTAQGMHNTAEAIRKIAQNIYEAEMRNYNLIHG